MRVTATTTIDDGAHDVVALRDAFRTVGAVPLRGLIHVGLVDRLRSRLRDAAFAEDEVAGIGSRAVESADIVGGALRLVLGRPAVRAWVDAVTERGPFDEVAGGVTRLHVDPAHTLGWHDDRADGRRVAITIELSDADYDGGELEIRRRSDAETSRHRAAAFGDALLFDISRDREHRVLPVRAGGPRTVFTGWFIAR